MSFVKKAMSPPECEEGDILKAKIIDAKRETSQFKDDEGNLREQLRFDLELENGYKSRGWIACYDHPSDKSALGKLTLKLQQLTKHEINSIDEFISAIKSLGQVFVRVKGFRNYEDEQYPNFSIVTDKLPSTQQKIVEIPTTPVQTTQAKQTLAQFKDAITIGLPLNTEDLDKNLPIAERLTLFKEGLIEEKDGLYFFTSKAKELLGHNAV